MFVSEMILMRRTVSYDGSAIIMWSWSLLAGWLVYSVDMIRKKIYKAQHTSRAHPFEYYQQLILKFWLAIHPCLHCTLFGCSDEEKKWKGTPLVFPQYFG